MSWIERECSLVEIKEKRLHQQTPAEKFWEKLNAQIEEVNSIQDNYGSVWLRQYKEFDPRFESERDQRMQATKGKPKNGPCCCQRTFSFWTEPAFLMFWSNFSEALRVDRGV